MLQFCECILDMYVQSFIHCSSFMLFLVNFGHVQLIQYCVHVTGHCKWPVDNWESSAQNDPGETNHEQHVI